MGRFKGGVSVNHPKGSRTKDGKETKQKYHQIRAGPQRGQYVHDLIAEAKLGRPLEGDETAEHQGQRERTRRHAVGEPILNDELDQQLDQEQIEVMLGEEREPPCEFITGVAGSGKTFMVKKAVQDDPTYGVLSSTTGVSAVNLGAITVHSLLRYSTTQVLRDIWLQGRLTRTLHGIAKRVRRLMIDEISMGSAQQLDIFYRAAKEVNRYSDITEPFGITLVGDLLQLPPVNEPWCFKAECWPEFANNTTRLTKSYRQEEPEFVNALNLVRAGKGAEGAELLTKLGAKWESQIDTEFDGTSIFSMNDKVNRFNQIGLERVKGRQFIIESRRWGQQQHEWGFNHRHKEWGIPPLGRLKIGAYVMVLSNAQDFHYVNG